MWNKLVATLRDPSYKRLAAALCISVVLHALLFGGFDFSLPNLKEEMHVIEARLQMPKAVEKPEPEEIVAPEPIPEPPKPKPPKKELPVEPPPVVEESIEPNEPAETVVAEVTPEPVPVAVLPVEPPPAEPPPAESPPQVQPEAAPAEPQPVEAGLIINENAYQYVETDFDVRTEIDGSAVGKATITYNLTDGRNYQLKWLTEGRGLAALIFPDLLQTSEGVLINTGLQPSKYVYQFGKKADKSRTANFDWLKNVATLQTAKGTQTVDLGEGTQDMLSFMYQFMFVAPLQTMQIPITTGKKLAIYEYSFEGEEHITSALGELKTMHIVHSGGESDEKTELWLAIDYQYVPVKIRKIEKNGEVVEMVATRINTNRPTINQ